MGMCKRSPCVSFHACSRMRKLTWNNNWSHISLCKSSASYLNSCVRRWAEALRLCLGQPSGLIWLHEECVYTADSSDSRLSFGVFAHIIKRIWQIKKWEKKKQLWLVISRYSPCTVSNPPCEFSSRLFPARLHDLSVWPTREIVL